MSTLQLVKNTLEPQRHVGGRFASLLPAPCSRIRDMRATANFTEGNFHFQSAAFDGFVESLPVVDICEQWADIWDCHFSLVASAQYLWLTSFRTFAMLLARTQ